MIKIDNSTLELISEVSKMDTTSGVSQNIYIIEECSELIKELSDMIKILTKNERHKDDIEKNIFEEACDVLTTIFVMFHRKGIEPCLVKDQIERNCKNALQRYSQNKEV